LSNNYSTNNDLIIILHAVPCSQVRAIGAASYVRVLRPDAVELLDMVAAGTALEEDPEEDEGERAGPKLGL